MRSYNIFEARVNDNNKEEEQKTWRCDIDLYV